MHREHAIVETSGVRTAKAMGLRNLPSKSWQVNTGWVITANIAADLATWIRLLGHCDDPSLREAGPHTLRPGSGTSPPTRPPRPPADPEDQPGLALNGRVPRLLATALRLATHPPDQHEPPQRRKGAHPRRGRSRCAPGHTGHHRATATTSQTDTALETGQQHNQ
jgi:hypothetical protein